MEGLGVILFLGAFFMLIGGGIMLLVAIRIRSLVKPALICLGLGGIMMALSTAMCTYHVRP